MTTETAAVPQHVYAVSEIRDGTLRRMHGYFASLQGAFGYCETEERKKPLVDTVRFELFVAPGGRRWLVHVFFGPEDRWPETSDFVIAQHEVTPDVPAAVSVVPPATNQTALRDRIAEALVDWAYRSADRKYTALRRDETVRANAYSRADAVLAVLPATGRGAALAGDLRYVLGHEEPGHDHEEPGVWDTSGKPCGHCARLAVARDNLAAYDANPEAGQAGEDRPETPLEKRLRYSERRNDELRAESLRRGKVKLEYAEKIVALERQIDEVRGQLGAEILRAGQAEAELRRLAAEAPTVPDTGDDHSCAESGCTGEPTAAEAPHTATPDEAPWLSDSARIGRALIWSWADVGKGAFGEGYRAAQAEARALLGGERGSDQQPPAVVAQPGKETAS